MAEDGQIFPETAGFHDIGFVASVGEVDISLAIPKKTSVNTALVLVLHYAGQPTRFYGRPLLENLILPSFNGVEAIFVAPTSLGGDWREPHNITAVFEIMNELEKYYGTNIKRRVVTGYSMGAVGSWLMPIEQAGYFSAAIPIAGYPIRAPLDCQTPSYAIMSDKDEVFALEPFQILIDELQKKECPVKAEIISGAGHYDIGAFQSALSNAVAWLGDMWGAKLE